MTVCTIEIINLIYLESLDKFLAVKLNGIANISSVKTGYFEAWGGGGRKEGREDIRNVPKYVIVKIDYILSAK